MRGLRESCAATWASVSPRATGRKTSDSRGVRPSVTREESLRRGDCPVRIYGFPGRGTDEAPHGLDDRTDIAELGDVAVVVERDQAGIRDTPGQLAGAFQRDNLVVARGQHERRHAQFREQVGQSARAAISRSPTIISGVADSRMIRAKIWRSSGVAFGRR